MKAFPGAGKTWEDAINDFLIYLRLERSLSETQEMPTCTM